MAAIAPIIGGAMSLVGSGIGGFFGFKGKQAELVQGAIDVVGDVNRSDADYAQASANAISSLYENGPPIERMWRPLLMWIIIIMIVCRWFGLVPPHIEKEEVLIVYNWLEIGLIGYIPLRSMEKIMKGFQIGSVLKTFISKKLG